MFTATRKFRFSKRIHTPHHVALAFIQQPINLMDLSPVVTNKVASEDDPNFYVITDKLTFLGISFDTTYTARFTLREGGLDAACHAAGGVELVNYWRANVVDSEGRDGDEGEGTVVTEVVEDVTVKANIFLLPFTVSGLTRAHTTMMEKLAEKLGTETSSRESGKGDHEAIVASGGEQEVGPEPEEPSNPPPVTVVGTTST